MERYLYEPLLHATLAPHQLPFVDLNSDGIDDLVIGAAGALRSSTNFPDFSGSVYTIYGERSGAIASSYDDLAISRSQEAGHS